MSSITEQNKRELSIFLQLLEENPASARIVLKGKPIVGELLMTLMAPVLNEKDDMSKNIPFLLRRYLTVDPQATVLCLGSGTGIELPQVRKIFPKGRIVGIDRSNDPEVTQSSVINEFRAKAEFYPMDLAQISPEEVIYQLGEVPSIVLCRHPNVYSNGGWIKTLANWGLAAKRNSTQLLITTFHEEEMFPVVAGLNIMGLSPIQDRWMHGDILIDPESKEQIINDRFVAGINIRR